MPTRFKTHFDSLAGQEAGTPARPGASDAIYLDSGQVGSDGLAQFAAAAFGPDNAAILSGVPNPEAAGSLSLADSTVPFGSSSQPGLTVFGLDNSQFVANPFALVNGVNAASSFGQIGTNSVFLLPSYVNVSASLAPSRSLAPSHAAKIPSVSPAPETSPGISGIALPSSSLAMPAIEEGARPAVIVSTSGSGLVFDNTYDSSCTAQYEACIVAAEDELESLISNSVTINVSFSEQDQGNTGGALGNSSGGWLVSYSTLKTALLKVAPGDVLPATDPSGGANWYIPDSYARMLGLESAVGSPDLSVTLNTYYSWDYGQDVINGLTHELSEGGLGRIGALGGTSGGGGNWSTMDLFRYNAAGQPDYTDGRDGDTTYFSANGGSTLSNENLPGKGAPTLSYNNQYNTNGTLNNKGDTADWTQEAVFGSVGGGETLALTQTELDVLQALGWTIALKEDVDAHAGTWQTPTNWSTGSMPIEAQDAYINGVSVSLDSNVIVNSIATSANAILTIGDSAHTKLTAVDGTVLNSEDVSFVASGNLGNILVYTGSALQIGFVNETFFNAGTIALGKGAGGSGAGDLDIAGSIDLNGAGTITLGETGTTGDILNAPGLNGSLANVNNTISGSGLIQLGGTFDNQADGIVKAQSNLQVSAGTFTNEGDTYAEKNATLAFGASGSTQSLDNTGSVLLEAGADLAIGGSYSVTGSGGIYLKGAGAEITSDGAKATFANASTIEADYSGTIGDSDLTFSNSGSVAASLSGVVLTIDTGANNVTNTGTLAAVNGATLQIESGLTNKGNVAAGGISSTETTTGTLDLGLDGGTASAANSGGIDIYGDSRLAISGNYTVSGGGQIAFKGAGAAITSDGTGPATFTNASTIEAFYSGQIGDVGIEPTSDLTFVNKGSVIAVGSGTTLTLNTVSNTVNDSGGVLEAETGATLNSLSNINTGTGGTIEAGSGGNVLLRGLVSGSGVLSAAAGTVLDVIGGATFAGSITGAGTVEIAGVTTLDAGASLSVANLVETANLTLSGVSVTNAAADIFAIGAAGGTTVTLGGTGTSSFTNNGSLLVNGAGAAHISVALIDNGTISVASGSLQMSGALSGDGALAIGAGSSAYITAGGTLTETISGAGTLILGGNYTLSGADVAAGTVQVNGPHVLSGTGTLAGAVIDNGTVQASGGILQIGGAVSGNGTLSAASGAVLDLAGGGNFAGTIGGDGVVLIAAATTLDAGAKLSAFEITETANLTLASVAVTNTASDNFVIAAAASTTVTLASSGTGSFTNAGSLVVNGSGTARISTALIDNGTVSLTSGSLTVTGALTGTGTLAIGAGTSAYITAGGTLTETISGAGTLILGGAYTVSEADLTVGTVQVNGPHELSGTGTLAGAVTDSGTVAAAAGTLLIGGAVSGGGTLSAGSGAVLDLAGGGSLSGAITGAGTVTLAGATTLTAGAKLSAADVIETAKLTLASVAVTNTAGDVFALTAATGSTITLGSTGTGAFVNAGSLSANGAGTADISAKFTNSGTVSALSGTLAFLGAIAGTGALDLGGAGTLSLGLGAGSGQTVNFLATTGVLDLANPLDFVGAISGFGGSDQIFLENTAETGFGYNLGTDILTVTGSTGTVASLHITESSNGFSVVNENHGVLITFS